MGADDTDTAAPAPAVDPDSALPSVAARIVAFVAILVGGAGGAIIGYSFSNIQCHRGSCALADGSWMLAGTLGGSLGVAVIAVLSLRAVGEWRSGQVREPDQTNRSRRKPSA